jgi:hypothetical protein
MRSGSPENKGKVDLMKKHLFMTLGSVAAIFSLAVYGETPRDPYFDTTMKHVDAGGEMLSYNNISEQMKSFDNTIKNISSFATDDPAVQTAILIVGRTLDLTSFKGVAQSSANVERGVYVYKSFALTDENSKSVLSGKAVQKAELEPIMKSLPANTRLAVYSNINSQYLRQRLEEEIAASGNQKIIQAWNNFQIKAKAKGIDFNALASSVSGPMLLAITGSNPFDLKIVAIINDKDGVLSALLSKKFPPKAGESAHPVKSLESFMPKAQLVYGDGCIMFVSDPAIMKKPEKMLGDTPRYRKYAAYLPKEGSGFLVVNLSKKFTESVNAFIPPQYGKLKPTCLFAVDTVAENGVGCVAASNFSIPSSFARLVERMTKIALISANETQLKKQAPEQPQANVAEQPKEQAPEQPAK